MSTTAPTPKPGTNPPSVMVDLGQKDVKQLRGLKVGDVVKITLLGDVTELSTREPDTSFPRGFAGNIRIDVNRTTIDKQSAFSDLLDE